MFLLNIDCDDAIASFIVYICKESRTDIWQTFYQRDKMPNIFYICLYLAYLLLLELAT